MDGIRRFRVVQLPGESVEEAIIATIPKWLRPWAIIDVIVIKQ